MQLNFDEEVFDLDSDVSNNLIRASQFSEYSLTNPNDLIYEQSNSLVNSYQQMTYSEKALLVAGLVAVHKVNKDTPFTEQEKAAGIKISVPIKDVAALMGYDIEHEKKNKAHYKAIKNASVGLRQATFIKEVKNESGTRSFDSFGLIDRIKYNENDNGQVTFFFSGGSTDYILDNQGDFTLYNVMLRNRIEKAGQTGTTRLHEILKTALYKAKESPTGTFDIYYDYVDLRLKMGFIKSNEEVIKHILNSKEYMQIEDRPTAYARMLAIKKVDEPIRKEIAEYKNSFEYKNIDKKDKEQVEKAKERIKLLNDRIVSQYNQYKDFKRRVLIPSQQTFLECIRDYPDLMEFMFEYEPSYYRNNVIGILFTIYTVDAYKKKEKSLGTQMSIFEYLGDDANKKTKRVEKDYFEDARGAVKGEVLERPGRKRTKAVISDTLEKISEYIKEHPSKHEELSAIELYRLSEKYDFDTIKNNYDYMNSQKGIESPAAWLTAACRDNYASNKKKRIPKTMFHDFQQNEYDFDNLEKQLLKR